MAFILPSNVEFKNYAEEKVYKYIKENLPENHELIIITILI